MKEEEEDVDLWLKPSKLTRFSHHPISLKLWKCTRVNLNENGGRGGGGVKEVVNIVNNIVDHKLSKI